MLRCVARFSRRPPAKEQYGGDAAKFRLEAEATLLRHEQVGEEYNRSARSPKA